MEGLYGGSISTNIISPAGYTSHNHWIGSKNHGTSTGQPIFYHQIPRFPVNFPLTTIQ